MLIKLLGTVLGDIKCVTEYNALAMLCGLTVRKKTILFVGVLLAVKVWRSINL